MRRIRERTRRENFPGEIIEDAGERQDWLCAYCGEPLHDENEEALIDFDGHHLNGDPADHRLKNCALLCRESDQNCHLDAHLGNFDGPDVLPDADFDFLFGDPDEEAEEDWFGPPLPDD